MEPIKTDWPAEAKKVEQALGAAYGQAVETAYGLSAALRSDRPSTPDLVDVGILLRDAEELADRIRKDVKAMRELVGTVIAREIVGESANDPGAPLHRRGKLGSANADVRTTPRMPKRGTPEYYQLLEALGVPPEMARLRVLSPHWEGLSDLLTTATKTGAQVPSGLLGTSNEPIVTFRHSARKKGTKSDG